MLFSLILIWMQAIGQPLGSLQISWVVIFPLETILLSLRPALKDRLILILSFLSLWWNEEASKVLVYGVKKKMGKSFQHRYLEKQNISLGRKQNSLSINSNKFYAIFCALEWALILGVQMWLSWSECASPQIHMLTFWPRRVVVLAGGALGGLMLQDTPWAYRQVRTQQEDTRCKPGRGISQKAQRRCLHVGLLGLQLCEPCVSLVYQLVYRWYLQ